MHPVLRALPAVPGPQSEDLAHPVAGHGQRHVDRPVRDLTVSDLLAEIGDDRTRFADARALKAYAGAAPVTRALGRSHAVVARKVKNRRLAAAGYMWAFAALRSAEPRTHYDRRREAGERHTAAPRNLFNKLLGCLFHCLQEGTLYDPGRAFGLPLALAA